MIYDAFMYSGEENILKIRLETLNSLVDKFIILESNKSHSLIPRKLEFPEQQARFEKFKDKILYLAADYCTNSNFHYNDFQGRQVIQHVLLNDLKFSNKDILIHGDLDEIPNEFVITDIIKNHDLKEAYTLMLDNRTLCFDLEPGNNGGKFGGSMVLNHTHLTNNPLYMLRQNRQSNSIVPFKLIDNAGWHLSYNAGIEKTIDKIRFFCHADETGSWIKTKDGLINCIRNKIAFWDNKTPLNKIEWKQENFPSFVYNNKEEFKENLTSFYD